MSSVSAIRPILEVGSVLERLSSLPVETFAPGEMVLAAGQSTGRLYLMIEGAVEVVRNGVRIAEESAPGAVFGELAILLGQPHTADVRALRPSRFYVADGRTFLRIDPTAALYVAMVLARRLDAVNRHLIEAQNRLKTEPRGRVLEETVENIAEALRYGPPM